MNSSNYHHTYIDYLIGEGMEDDEDVQELIDTKPCHACFGTGMDRYEDADCMNCYGDGVITNASF